MTRYANVLRQRLAGIGLALMTFAFLSAGCGKKETASEENPNPMMKATLARRQQEAKQAPDAKKAPTTP